VRGRAQVVEHLALSSKPQYCKKKKEKRKEERKKRKEKKVNFKAQ
jgi:hypothetical protein